MLLLRALPLLLLFPKPFLPPPPPLRRGEWWLLFAASPTAIVVAVSHRSISSGACTSSFAVYTHRASPISICTRTVTPSRRAVITMIDCSSSTRRSR
jgi:hypothetical protein